MFDTAESQRIVRAAPGAVLLCWLDFARTAFAAGDTRVRAATTKQVCHDETLSTFSQMDWSTAFRAS